MDLQINYNKKSGNTYYKIDGKRVSKLVYYDTIKYEQAVNNKQLHSLQTKDRTGYTKHTGVLS